MASLDHDELRVLYQHIAGHDGVPKTSNANHVCLFQPSVVLPYIAELLDHLQKQEGVLLRVDSDHRASTVAGGTSQGPGQVVWRYQLEGEVTEDKQVSPTGRTYISEGHTKYVLP